MSLYCDSSFMIIITRLLCFMGQLMPDVNCLIKMSALCVFMFFTYDFDSFDFDMIMWNCLRGLII